MSLQPKPEVKNLKVSPHGGPNWAELRAIGLTPEEILDFSVSANPFAPPLEVQEILGGVAINCYPDSESTELRECLSERLGVTPENILAGNGSTEIIRLIALTYFGQGDSVLILEPAFGEYEVACQIVGAEVVKQWRKAEDGFSPDIEATAELIRQCRLKGIFICNPDNPTGNYLSREEIETILASSEDSLFILDEAFIALVDKSWSSIDLIHRGNVIIVRSMTKDYGLAGLRLGYAIAHTEIVDNLHRVQPPWSVNAIAQKAGTAALKSTGYLERCKPKIERAKQFLIGELKRIGLTPVPSQANFFLVRVGDGGAFRTALLRHKILVRDCTSFGLPEYIRIAPRTMPDCQKLIAAIKTLKHEGALNDSL